MGINISAINGGAIESVADLAGGIINRIWPPDVSPAEKAAAQLEVQKMLERREAALLTTQREVMVAEMAQGDAYTKRARPTIVYMGLAFIGLVHVVFPIAAWYALEVLDKAATMPDISLPGEFWAAWGGVCSVWVVGRTLEKRGAGGLAGKAASIITGSR